MNRLIFFALFACFSAPSSILGQNVKYRSSLGIDYLPGFLLAHTADVENLSAHVYGIALQYTSQPLEGRNWTKCYKRPKVGVNAFYMNLGLPQLTGEVYAIMPNFEVSLLDRPRSEIGLRFGTGLGYVTKSFDVFRNRRNIAIGSHVNGAIQIMFFYNKNWKHLIFKSGLGITHFSNASVRVPNLGINMPTLFAGLHYIFPDKIRKPFSTDSIRQFPLEVFLAIAFNERSLVQPRQFVIGHAAFLGEKRLSIIRRWHWGGDIFLDKTHQFMTKKGEPLTGLKPKEMTEIGLRAGLVWRVARLDLSGDIGFYLYKPSKNKAFTYQMVGIKYHCTQRFFLQTNLKVHFATADFVEWGLGYKFHSKR
jgi:hypothetical protein